MSYPGKKSAWEQLMDFNAGDYVKAHVLQGEAGRLLRLVEDFGQRKEVDALQAVMEFEPNIR